MNDEETVALIAGGHTFGKTHGAAGPDGRGRPRARRRSHRAAGHGLDQPHGTGKGADAITSGLEVTWTYHPTRWDNEFFHILFAYEWELTESPAGAKQWRPKNGGGADLVPEAFGDGKREPRDAHHATSRCASTPSTSRSRAGSTRTPRSSRTRSRAPGTS